MEPLHNRDLLISLFHMYILFIYLFFLAVHFGFGRAFDLQFLQLLFYMYITF